MSARNGVSTKGILLPVLGVVVGLSALCSAQTVTLSVAGGPPTTYVRISGLGFPSNGTVDIFFDAVDLAATLTNGKGSFSQVKIQIPASALPGIHRITAKARGTDVAGQSPFAVNTNWPTYQFSSSLNGTNPYENVLSASAVPGLSVLWSHSVGGFVTSGSTVANGTVYATSNSGFVAALNARTGAPRWKFSRSGSVDSAPTAANGKVYLGSENHKVYALNASNGSVAWTFTTGSFVSATPVVANGVVYIGSNFGDSSVYALNAKTGAVLWKTTLDQGVASAVAVAEGIVYAADVSGTLYALNATNGAKVWTYSPGSSAFQSPTVANGIVYYGVGFPTNCGVDCGTIYALDAHTGTLLWSFATSSDLLGASPAVANGIIYDSSFDTLYALNASTGALLWTFNTKDGVGTVAIADGVVYFGSEDDNLYALDAVTGALLWQYATGGSIQLTSGPSIVNGTVYVGSGDQHVYAFGLPPTSVSRPRASALRARIP